MQIRFPRLISLFAPLAFAALAVPAFAGHFRAVFILMDSTFKVHSRFENAFSGLSDPDSALVRRTVDAEAGSYTRLNSRPIDELWLAYMPPADPGQIIYFSNTVPPRRMLTLEIDAMCGSCMTYYRFNAFVLTTRDSAVTKENVEVAALENDFGLGAALTPAEKAGIALHFNDPAFTRSDARFRINVLKVRAELTSLRGTAYVAYATIPGNPSSGVRIPAVESKAQRKPSPSDALGRMKAGRHGGWTWSGPPPLLED